MGRMFRHRSTVPEYHAGLCHSGLHVRGSPAPVPPTFPQVLTYGAVPPPALLQMPQWPHVPYTLPVSPYPATETLSVHVRVKPSHGRLVKLSLRRMEDSLLAA